MYWKDCWLKLKFPYFGHLMWRASSLEKALMLRKSERKRRKGQQRMRWLDIITDSMDEFEQTPEDSEGQWSQACYSPWGWTQLSNGTATKMEQRPFPGTSASCNTSVWNFSILNHLKLNFDFSSPEIFFFSNLHLIAKWWSLKGFLISGKWSCLWY